MNNNYVVNLLVLSSLSILATNSAQAFSVTLYNGSGNPEEQGYLAPGALNSSGLPVDFQGTVVTDGIEVDSNANEAEYSGYSNHVPNPSAPSQLVLVNSEFPNLEQDSGYSIFFTVTLDTQNDFSDPADNRSAFSITVIGNQNEGIELGFDSEQIFAQDSDFNRQETSSFTTSNPNNYELKVNSSGYQLLANGEATPILNGSLRTYNFNPAASEPPLPFNPYTTENFLFLGDNTGQAYGNFTLGAVSVSSVPFEFSPTLGLAISGIVISLRRLYIHRKNKLIR